MTSGRWARWASTSTFCRGRAAWRMAPDEASDGTVGPLCLTVLAIDPGREKNGLAVVRAGSILARAIVSPEALVSQVCAWRDAYRPAHLLIGSGTGHRVVLTRLD